MKDPSVDFPPMSFDGYLKLFQLQSRVDFAEAINFEWQFDVILVDEAQVSYPLVKEAAEVRSRPI